MRQVIVDFGTLHLMGLDLPLRIYGYGLMLVLGFLISIGLAQWRARRVGESPETIARCGILSIVGGLAGARIAYVIQHWAQFANSDNTLGSILNVSSGGLIYYGGLILGALMVTGYLFAKRVPVRRYLDILAVSIMVGLAFGRAGCLLNGCCFGGPCDKNWALGMSFPMYSQPLLKFGDTAGPFSASTEAPSPVFAHQFDERMLKVDDRLILNIKGLDHAGTVSTMESVRLPRYLHGQLDKDQLAVMFGAEDDAKAKFLAAAGTDGKIDHAEWTEALKGKGGLLAGSEGWDEAMVYANARRGLGEEQTRLSFDEFWRYLGDRRRQIIERFGGEGGKLTAPQAAAANEYLQADLYKVASEQWSSPVKPSQAIGIVNALMLAGLLVLFYRLRNREGQVFALLLIMYPITRFVEELIRDDNPHDLLTGVLTHNQWTSIILLLCGVAMMICLRFVPASAGKALADRLAESSLPSTRQKPKKNLST